jgi:thiol-disulfide isomerase/thioredoxin
MKTGTGLFARMLAAALIAAAAALAIAGPAPVRTDAAPKITGEIQYFKLERNPRPVTVPAFHDGMGREVTLAAFAGKVVVMNFWATWCYPCLKEMPSLDRLAARFRGRPFALVALNLDREGAVKAAPFLAEHRLSNVQLYIDPPGKVQRALGVTVLPTTVIFDATGREVGRLERPAEWDSHEARALVDYFVRQVD